MLSSTGSRRSQWSGSLWLRSADGSQLGATFELVQTSSGAAWVLETHPRRDCANPIGAGSFVEQVVGVRIEAGALNQDDRIDAVTLE